MNRALLGFSQKARHTAGLLFVGLCLTGLVTAVYSPGLSGTFQLDDYANIVHQSGLHAQDPGFKSLFRATREASTSITGRPIPVISFALDHAAGGLVPRQFIRTNIAIHALATLAAFCAAIGLLKFSRIPRIQVAALVAACWALHPINLTGVLYIVQRMTSLSALFSLLAIGLYLAVRHRHSLSWQATLCAFVAFHGLVLAAILCKENAILIPILLLAFEATVGAARSPLEVIHHRRMFWGCVAIPSLVVALAFIARIPGFIDSFDARDYGMVERLLTQFRVLVLYLTQIVLPRPDTMTLYHDGYLVSRGLLSPPTTLVCASFLAGATSLAVKFRRRYPWLCFGWLFFLAGHLLESTIAPLELVFEHRNYLPSFGLVAGVAIHAAEYFTSRPYASSRNRPVMVVLSVFIVVTLSALTHGRAQSWGQPLQLLQISLHHHPESPRVQEQAADLLTVRCLSTGADASEPICKEAVQRYRLAADLDQNNAGSLIEAAQVLHATDQPIPNSLNVTITNRLKNQPGGWINANVLAAALVEADARVRLPSLLLANWAEAFINNEKNRSLARVAVMNNYAQLLFNRMYQHEYALSVMQKAAKLGSDRLDVQINYLKLLIAAGQTDQAKKQLSAIRNTPGAWAYSSSIERIAGQWAPSP